MFFEIFAPILWSVILITTLVLTFKLKDIDSLFVSISSLILFIISLVLPKFNFLYQCLIFIGLVLIQFLSIGLIVKKHNKTIKLQLASDQLIGKEIVVLEDCNEFVKATGKIDDTIWKITCQSGHKVNKGDNAIIVAIENNTLIIKNK